MANINQATLVGRVGNIERRPNGPARLSIATNYTRTDDAGQKVEHTQWHTVVCWGARADFAERWARKGRLVFVQGRLQYSEYMRQGEDKARRSCEVVAEKLEFMDRKPEVGE